MNRYRVELEELEAFVERLQNFEQRAATIGEAVDARVAHLHGSWFGAASEAHRSQHAAWTAAATQMREAVAELRTAADRAHRNYTKVIEVNTAMWP